MPMHAVRRPRRVGALASSPPRTAPTEDQRCREWPQSFVSSSNSIRGQSENVAFTALDAGIDALKLSSAESREPLRPAYERVQLRRPKSSSRPSPDHEAGRAGGSRQLASVLGRSSTSRRILTRLIISPERWHASAEQRRVQVASHQFAKPVSRGACISRRSRSSIGHHRVPHQLGKRYQASSGFRDSFFASLADRAGVPIIPACGMTRNIQPSISVFGLWRVALKRVGRKQTNVRGWLGTGRDSYIAGLSLWELQHYGGGWHNP